MLPTLLLTCPKFIPPVLAREAESLGYNVKNIYPAGVAIEAHLGNPIQDIMNLNLHLRTAHRVLFLLKDFRARTPDDLYHAAFSLPWEEYLLPEGYFSVVSSVDTPTINNTQFANLKLKDAIVDRMRAKFNKRPNSGSATDKAVVFLYWKGSDCAIYIDTSGTPLSKRGYRTMPHKAPMSELLAAAVIQSTSWQPGEHFINPMCGSGTLAIEAAFMATNTPAQWHRSNFSFMHLRGFVPERWEQVRASAKKNIRQEISGQIVASDRDSNAIMATRRNAQAAGMLPFLDVQMGDFRKTPVPEGKGIVILNPEYGERLGASTALAEVYEQIGDWFKKECSGKKGYIFTGNMDLAKKIGLKTSRRIEFFNADIECRLLEYELYDGSRKAKYKTEVAAE